MVVPRALVLNPRVVVVDPRALVVVPTLAEVWWRAAVVEGVLAAAERA